MANTADVPAAAATPLAPKSPLSRMTRVSGFQDRGFRPEIPLVERSAVTGGKPEGKKRRLSLRDPFLRSIQEKGVEEVARPFELAGDGVGVARKVIVAPAWYSGVLWPMSSDATFGVTPAWSSQVAAVWRDAVASIPGRHRAVSRTALRRIRSSFGLLSARRPPPRQR